MRFEGQAIHASMLDGGIVELQFDLRGESVNKFNRATLAELREVLDLIKGDPAVKGLLVTSAFYSSDDSGLKRLPFFEQLVLALGVSFLDA